MTNIFKQAQELLAARDDGQELTEEETATLALSVRALDFFPEYDHIPLATGLGKLTKLVEQ